MFSWFSSGVDNKSPNVVEKNEFSGFTVFDSNKIDNDSNKTNINKKVESDNLLSETSWTRDTNTGRLIRA